MFHRKSIHISSFYRTFSETEGVLQNHTYNLLFFHPHHICTYAWCFESSFLNVLPRFSCVLSPSFPPWILFNLGLSVRVFLWPLLLLYLSRPLSVSDNICWRVLFFLFYGGQIYESYFSKIKFKAHGKSRSGIFLALICRWHKDWQSCFTEQFGLYNKISYSNKMCFSTARYARTTCSHFGYKVEEYYKKQFERHLLWWGYNK